MAEITSNIEAIKEDYAQNKIMLQLVGVSAFVTLIGGATFYHIFEKLRWLDAFYFSTITLTTIGYGDISPQTDIGKLFTMFYVLLGIGIIGAFANFFLKNTMYRRTIRHHKRNTK